MGSSKTGSLDKFVPVSPAAAFASGKVKLPETGLIGMMQQNQEDKMAMNAANIAAQQPSQQQNQYNQMLQQMMMNQQRPSLYSPAPYANGGNVTLRRKMFKLGGSASAHGTGLTSGLSFNEGGRVGLQEGGMSISEIAKKFKLGGAKAGEALSKAPIKGRRGLAQSGLGALLTTIFGRAGPAIGRATGRRSMRPIQAFLRQNPRTGRFLLGTAGIGGGLGAASALSNIAPDFEEFGQSEDSAPFAKLIAGARENLLDPFISVTPAGGLFYGFTGDTAGEALRELGGKEPRVAGDDALAGGRTIEDDISPDDLAAKIAQQSEDRTREAMEMYQDLIRGDDDVNKLTTLGSALIAGGSALMEGEGYGAAARAFNEPLATAMAGEDAAEAEARAAAAQLAIGENITRQAAEDELAMNLLAGGDFATEAEVQAVLTARKVGINTRIPETDDGEVDEDAIVGGSVYVDPRQRYGTLFVAVNNNVPLTKDDLIYTNDPEKAKAHAES